MRKIKTKKDIEKVQRRNNVILGLIMIFLLIASSIGYSLMSSDNNSSANSVSENGFDFVKSGGMWSTKIANEVFYFENLPSEVSDIKVNLTKSLENYYGEPLYFVGESEGISEVLNNLNNYVLRYQEACLQEVNISGGIEILELSKCNGDLPIKDCSNNLIIFTNGENEVYEQDSCVYLVGNNIKVTDAFLYKILGIL